MAGIVLWAALAPSACADQATSPGGADLELAIVDLGTLGGDDSWAKGVNNRGWVVGASATGQGSRHAFLWTADRGMIDLGTLGGASSSAEAVNDAGQVVGSSSTVVGSTRATLWEEDGGVIDLAGDGAELSIAFGINASGRAVGWIRSDEAHRAFTWTRSSGLRLLSNAGGESFASGLDDSGVIVGLVTVDGAPGRAAVWDAASEAALLPGLVGGDGAAFDISPLGTIVGVEHPPEARTEVIAVRWTSEGPEGLGTLGGDFAEALAINALDQIVGFSATAPGEVHAFLWSPETGMRDLGTLGGCCSGAWDISDDGNVVGWSQNLAGERRAVLWSPVSN